MSGAAPKTKGLLLYPETFPAFCALSRIDRGELIEICMSFFEDPDCEPVIESYAVRVAWAMVRPRVEMAMERYEARVEASKNNRVQQEPGRR